MKILIKQFFLISFLTFLSSCNQQTTPDTTINKKGESSESNIRTECIIGERINGPANIRSRVNGDILFTLYDSTLISCTEPQNNWYAVGLSMEIPNSDLDNDTLRKGRKIIVDGKVVGEVLKDMYVSTSTDYKHSWAELTGYTHKDNVYPFSIIEKALSDYLAKANKRSMETFQPFIKSFQMEKSEV